MTSLQIECYSPSESSGSMMYSSAWIPRNELRGHYRLGRCFSFGNQRELENGTIEINKMLVDHSDSSHGIQARHLIPLVCSASYDSVVQRFEQLSTPTREHTVRLPNCSRIMRPLTPKAKEGKAFSFDGYSTVTSMGSREEGDLLIVPCLQQEKYGVLLDACSMTSPTGKTSYVNDVNEFDEMKETWSGISASLHSNDGELRESRVAIRSEDESQPSDGSSTLGLEQVGVYMKAVLAAQGIPSVEADMSSFFNGASGNTAGSEYAIADLGMVENSEEDWYAFSLCG